MKNMSLEDFLEEHGCTDIKIDEYKGKAEFTISIDGGTYEYPFEINLEDFKTEVHSLAGFFSKSDCMSYFGADYEEPGEGLYDDIEMAATEVAQTLNELDVDIREIVDWNDRDDVLRAINEGVDGIENYNILSYASPELKADRDVVLAAVRKDGSAIRLASPELKADKDVVLAALDSDGMALQYVSSELKGDKQVVMAAVRDNGQALYYASDEMRADKEVVMKAVQNDWLPEGSYCLQYASDKLKDDIDVVRAAVKENPEALQFASERIQNNPSLLDKKPSLDEIIASAQERANQNKGIGKEAPKKEKTI